MPEQWPLVGSWPDAELDIDPELSLAEAYRIAHDAEHDLIHAVPKLTTAMIHAYPAHEDNVTEKHRHGVESRPSSHQHG
jgi:divalent metal cation (Fe/Co/Zn/Cd) transporter